MIDLTEKLKNIFSNLTIDYIIDVTFNDYEQTKKNSKLSSSEKNPPDLRQKVTDYIAKENLSFANRLRSKNLNYKNVKTLFKNMKRFGVIFIYDSLIQTLKERNNKYYNKLIREIRKNKEEAEINLDYLEQIIPEMKWINSQMGFYNKKH